MLLGRKRYNYFTMLILYAKLVPAALAVKIAYNLVKSIIPTLNIIINARFLDAAVAVVSDYGKLSGVVFPLCAIIAVSLFNNYSGLVIRLVDTRANNKIRLIVAPAIAEKRARVKFRYYENQESVDIINRATGDFEKNLQGFFDQVFRVWGTFTQLSGFIIILGMQLWWATVIFVATCIPSFIISYKLGKKQYDVNKDVTKVERKAGYIFNILTSRETIEERYIYGYTKKMNEEYRDKYEIARIARKNVDKASRINRRASGMLAFVSGVIVIAILIPSAIFPDASGEIKLTVGMFTSLVNAVLGISMEMQWNISDQISQFKYNFEYLKDLNEFLDFEEDDDATCLPGKSIPGLDSIEFKDVSFKYPGTERYILNNFNLKLESRKHYAIVGANGAGKTTLTKLITGLYKEYEGEIYINGKELKSYTQAELKALLAVAYQDFCRYPLDFYSNIAIGNVNDMQNREKVERAVKIIGLSEAVEKLPKKYETPITKVKRDGVDMSGGEWQKIALARLLVSTAPLKILDEPTAALDPISEVRVYKQFGKIVDKNHANKTAGITIFISHRLGLTKLVDEIIVISGGKVAEAGTFCELMAKGGIFAEMYSSQSEWYKDEASKPRSEKYA